MSSPILTPESGAFSFFLELDRLGPRSKDLKSAASNHELMGQIAQMIR